MSSERCEKTGSFCLCQSWEVFHSAEKGLGKKEIKGHIWTERLSGMVAVGQQH